MLILFAHRWGHNTLVYVAHYKDSRIQYQDLLLYMPDNCSVDLNLAGNYALYEVSVGNVDSTLSTRILISCPRLS